MLELHTPTQAAQWLRSHVSGRLQTDSRKVGPGDGFIAWPGAATDGRQHVPAALQNGAKACLVEALDSQRFGFSGESIAAYPDLKAASGPIAAAYFEQPSQRLDVVAITGTNGKTTTAWWLAHLLSNSELSVLSPCAFVGTLGIGKPIKSTPDAQFSFDVVSNGLTTPDPILLQQNFREFVTEGVRACAIEASSIGIEEHRLDGTHIRCAVFTNFTQDHLDYHGTMAAYWQSKAALFQWPGLQSAVINVDDAKGAGLAASLSSNASSNKLDVWTVSCMGPARLRAQNVSYNTDGLQFELVENTASGEERHALQTALIGHYNVSNLLGVIGAMRALGVPLKTCIASCKFLASVPGRMECLGGGAEPLVVVDYAHTPDALAQTLQALRPLVDKRGGQLWCVFGCGGNRDAGKRPLMGAMAAQHADRIIVTSDNPRNEEPLAIIGQIVPGLADHAFVGIQADRALAIAKAVSQAHANDVVLVAGKGHENYQEIAGVKRAFSDQVQASNALRNWTASRTSAGVAA
jgi:UDP-N-acetylmuramoyl-L-alanyl-D-glutamate--2,6-diaminopimelate ligase